MKLIKKSIIASLALTSWAIAQEPSSEAPAANAQEQEMLPTTYEDFKEAFRSALPAGETGTIGNSSQIKVQENQVFLNGSDAAELMENYGNLPSTYHGAIVAIDESYVITFKFEETGYVKDDEKDELDADELLKSFKESEKAANEARKEAGLGSSTIVGWAFEPKYNESTNNLEWAIIAQDETGTQYVNHEIKILGRKGVMDAVLICDPSMLESLRPMLDETLAGFEYLEGNKYSEFKEGDKIAEYGLTGLIVGGGLLAAGKLGFFAVIGKFWKLIVGGIVAFFALIKNKIFGRK